MALELEDLLDGLREVIRRTAETGQSLSIRIVGGAALRIAYFDRPTTVDIDARIEPFEDLKPIVVQIARERNWPESWLNDEANQFIPSWGRQIDWRPLYDKDQISIWVAPIDALLAMKLHAVQGRPGRDTDDVAKLLRLNGIGDVRAAEAIYEDFYPGDGLNERSLLLLERMFHIGLPELPDAPPVIDLGGDAVRGKK